MRSRTLEFWPLAASLLLHGAALVGWAWGAGARTVSAPAARDVWEGRSVFVETVEERGSVKADPRPGPLPGRQPASGPAPRAEVHVAPPRTAASLPAAARPQHTPERASVGGGVDSAPLASGSAPRAAQSGEFGAEGLAPGVRRLAVAFTRAVPAATSRDPVWSSLPLGNAGSVRVEIRVNEAGHIVQTQTLEPSGVPDHLTRLLERTLLLLQRGRFAVSGVSAGDAEVFRIDVQVSMKEPTDGFEDAQVVRLGFDPPDARGRGKAFFTLGSGRHVEAAIRVERKRG